MVALCCTPLALWHHAPMRYRKIVADKLSAAGAPFALLIFVVASAFAKLPAPEVIFTSPCECEGFHGKNRWIVKTDFTPVPLDKSAIQSVTPSQIVRMGLRADRSPKGELGFYLINKRRQSESLSLPRAPAQFYQSDHPGRSLSRPYRG